MKITLNSSDERTQGYGPAYVIGADRPDFLVGRILTHIEALGLSEKQEKAIKDLARSEIYSVLECDKWIPGQLHTLIKEFVKECEKMPAPTTPDSVAYLPGEFVLTYSEE